MAEKRGRQGESRNMKCFLTAFATACAILFGLALFVDHWRDDMLSLYGLLGLGACAALVVIAKELRKAVVRSEEHSGR